jgi:hypothetical protein
VRRGAGGGGQENAFPWIERDCGIDFDESGLPLVDAQTFQSTLPQVFFGGDAASAPRTSSPRWRTGTRRGVDRPLLHSETRQRPRRRVNLMSQKMGIHEWSYDNSPSNDVRFKVPWASAEKALAASRWRSNSGFDAATALKEARAA